MIQHSSPLCQSNLVVIGEKRQQPCAGLTEWILQKARLISTRIYPALACLATRHIAEQSLGLNAIDLFVPRIRLLRGLRAVLRWTQMLRYDKFWLHSAAKVAVLHHKWVPNTVAIEQEKQRLSSANKAKAVTDIGSSRRR